MYCLYLHISDWICGVPWYFLILTYPVIACKTFDRFWIFPNSCCAHGIFTSECQMILHQLHDARLYRPKAYYILPCQCRFHSSFDCVAWELNWATNLWSQKLRFVLPSVSQVINVLPGNNKVEFVWGQ